METGGIGFLGYVQALAWPVVALTAIFVYRKLLGRLVPGSTIKLTISGFSIETTLPVLEESVMESLGGRKLTAAQIGLLEKLRDEGRSPFDRAESIELARSLRNAGLIKFYPEDGFLQDADDIEITTLGRLLIEAAERKSVVRGS